MESTKKMLGCLMMVLLMAAVSQAATISFTDKGWEAGDLSAAGQVMALNTGIDTDATVDGVTFTGLSGATYTENGVSVSLFSGATMADGGDLWNSQNSNNYQGTTFPTGADAETLLDNVSGAYNPAGGDGSIDFSGLTIGAIYQLQLIYNDDLNAGREMSIWSGDSPVGPADIVAQHGVRPDDLALLVTGTFTADATTQSLWMDFYGVPTDGDNGWINAMQLSEVPEPATVTLLGLGGLCSLIRRRRSR